MISTTPPRTPPLSSPSPIPTSKHRHSNPSVPAQTPIYPLLQSSRFGLCPAAALLIALGAIVATLLACAEAPSARLGSHQTLSPGIVRTISAKPRDLPSAISRASTSVALAVTDRADLPPIVLYTLVGAQGEPATITIEYARSAPHNPTPMRFTIHIGRLGDPARERALADHLESELKSLALDP